MRRAGPGVAAVAAAACAIVVAGCGGEDGGPLELTYMSQRDNAQTNVRAAEECSQQSGGKYTIEVTPLSASVDISRELLVRRLAAGDENIDLINMDTIWTPEFAEAGWLRELKGAEKEDALDDVLAGPAESVQWEGKTYGIPLNTNVQLLWYRKDLVPTPPKTWDEMVAMAKELPPGEGNILEMANKYEGYTVWFNNLVASGGGEIVDAEGRPKLNEATTKALEVIRNVATSGRVDASMSTMQEDQVRLAFEQGKGAFMLNWPFVYASARDAAESGDPTAKKVFDNMAWARVPGVEDGKPSKVSIGGANIGVSALGKDPALATQAALCMTSAKWQAEEAINEALPPVMNSTYDNAEVRKAYPFADELRDTLSESVTRPATPSYADVTLAIQDAIHPPAAVDPKASFDKLEDNLNVVADGGMF